MDFRLLGFHVPALVQHTGPYITMQKHTNELNWQEHADVGRWALMDRSQWVVTRTDRH